jgi:hypothetical protein
LKGCAILGDFNLDLVKAEVHQETQNFLSTLGSFLFQPQILRPTRITDHSATLIDNIFLNSLDHNSISGNLVYDLSDHLPNFLIIEKYSALSSNTKFCKRDYSSLDEIALLNDIQLINWNEVFQSDSDPDEMFDSFHDKISQVIDTHVPIKQLSKKELNVRIKPSITPAIRISIQKKNRIYKKYLKTRSTYYHSKFKFYRNKLNHLLKIRKRNYYDNYFLSKSGNSRDIWKGIKDLVGTKSQKYRAPTTINDNGLELNDPKSIANAFNIFFFYNWLISK